MDWSIHTEYFFTEQWVNSVTPGNMWQAVNEPLGEYSNLFRSWKLAQAISSFLLTSNWTKLWSFLKALEKYYPLPSPQTCFGLLDITVILSFTQRLCTLLSLYWRNAFQKETAGLKSVLDSYQPTECSYGPVRCRSLLPGKGGTVGRQLRVNQRQNQRTLKEGQAQECLILLLVSLWCRSMSLFDDPRARIVLQSRLLLSFCLKVSFYYPISFSLLVCFRLNNLYGPCVF